MNQYYNTYSAKKFLNLYIEYLKTKPVKYKGRTFKPMLYYGQQQYHFVYYDTKSYITDVKHNCGYSKIDKLSVLKREIDEREEEGQLVKIYNVV